jgi:hypothetical protein
LCSRVEAWLAENGSRSCSSWARWSSRTRCRSATAVRAAPALASEGSEPKAFIDATNTESVSSPIDSFDGASFAVGILGKYRRFEVTTPPQPDDAGRMTMTVNGERLERS